MTPQKVRAVLRKGGHPAAKFVRSRQVHGWGNWSSGYRVETYPRGGPVESIIVRYYHSNAESRLNQLRRCQATLEAAALPGVTVTMGVDNDCLILQAP